MRSRLLLLLLFTHPYWIPVQGQTYTIGGLQDSVQIIVDKWGVPHIYAENEADLFFAQGFYAARDRLFQFEIWRRQATGTVAEILGPRELKRDIGTRLFRFRGDIRRELNHYHPRGELIITSFVRGVNACIREALKDPGSLPVEFKLLGIKPGLWTPEVVISRHQGLLGNIGEELRTARLVALLGPEKVKELSWFHPGEPSLALDPKIDPDLLFEDLLDLYNAYRRPVEFRPEDIVAAVRNPNEKEYDNLARTDRRAWELSRQRELNDIGSNNWIIDGRHTLSGYPIMANDPHRTLAAPSLRYMALLHAPGWNVIGGGEPEIPGISIGHNEYGAWGLTVFRTDGEDLYVYRTHPEDPGQYWYDGAWEKMRLIQDTIPVKGQEPVVVTHKYTRHGPVLYEDPEKQTACAMRCAWLETGGSPYLASLRIDQARNFGEFREACSYSHIPGENMVWADHAGNIGWQSVGIAPLRRNFSGMVPVPGDGAYEWDGYLPIKAKPHVFNPEDGIFSTANQNLTPKDYPYMNAIGFSWSDPYRGARVEEFLGSGRKHSLMDMMSLQTDYLSIPARTLVPLLQPLMADNPLLEKIRTALLQWDYRLTKESVAAGIYNAWERILFQKMEEMVVPEQARPFYYLQMKQLIDWLLLPDDKFGAKPVEGRNTFLLNTLEEAVAGMQGKFGKEIQNWNLGQLNYKHVLIKHPLSNAVDAPMREKLNVGPVPRGGNSYTVNNTTGNDNQTHGATFRIIVDTGNWDHSVATNSPGQAGDPEDKHYRNLFDIWAQDQYFPLFFTREKIESVKDEVIHLTPPTKK
jgi:penicillin amidase